MILTGKAKEDFLKWVYSEYDFTHKSFNEIYPNNLQDHLIIEFLDSVGVYVEITTFSFQRWFTFSIKKFPVEYEGKELVRTRQESTKQAIIRANEIYNNS